MREPDLWRSMALFCMGRSLRYAGKRDSLERKEENSIKLPNKIYSRYRKGESIALHLLLRERPTPSLQAVAIMECSRNYCRYTHTHTHSRLSSRFSYFSHVSFHSVIPSYNVTKSFRVLLHNNRILRVNYVDTSREPKRNVYKLNHIEFRAQQKPTMDEQTDGQSRFHRLVCEGEKK